MRIAIALLGICVAACGADHDGSRVVVISTEVGLGEGVDLRSLSVVDEGSDRAVADFCVSQAMVVSLRGQHDETFCGKGRDFVRLADIPTATDDCPGGPGKTWSRFTYLGASAEHTADESYVAGDGYLVRGRDQTSLFRMLVVSDAYQDGTATVTLDVQPVQ